MIINSENVKLNYYKKAPFITQKMCIAAHQDDVEIMAYAQIADCYLSGGFSAVVLTDGAGSPRTGKFSDVSDEDMKTIRAYEQRKAAETGNYDSLIQLGYSSSEVKSGSEKVTADISSILLSFRPCEVFIHNLADKHDTHVASSLRTISALRRISGLFKAERVCMLEVWRGLDWVNDEDKAVFDASAFPELSEKLLNVYESQIEGGKEYCKAAVGRRYANATFFESHGIDSKPMLTYGVDITEFVYSSREPSDYMKDLINGFERDVLSRIVRMKGDS